MILLCEECKIAINSITNSIESFNNYQKRQLMKIVEMHQSGEPVQERLAAKEFAKIAEKAASDVQFCARTIILCETCSID